MISKVLKNRKVEALYLEGTRRVAASTPRKSLALRYVHTLYTGYAHFHTAIDGALLCATLGD